MLVFWITFHCHCIWGCICSTGPFPFRWLKGYSHSSWYYHHQIGSINLTHGCHNFPWLCAWDVCYSIFCHLIIAYTFQETRDFVLIILCSLWWAQIVGYVLAAYRVRLFVHYTISWSSLCKLIWRHWANKMPVRYILSSVWVRFSIFSQLSFIQYMGLCVLSLPVSLVVIEILYTLSYYHHQIGSMNYYPLFRVRSWNNDMRCMSLYILILITQ